MEVLRDERDDWRSAHVNRHQAFRASGHGRPPLAGRSRSRSLRTARSCCAGRRTVDQGYWENEAATREILDDHGWLHTGDLGSLDQDGFLSITGRIKDIIITAGGKNLTPANLENDLRQSPFISHAVMYGDRRPYPVALITLDPEAILPWAHERGLPENLSALSQHTDVHSLVQEAIDSSNSRYARAEQIKRFAILGHDFAQQIGELTPTLKVKRNVIYERYADTFDELYTP